MKELATVSETIVEEDTEVAMADRQLEEIDEQLHRWNRYAKGNFQETRFSLQLGLYQAIYFVC